MKRLLPAVLAAALTSPGCLLYTSDDDDCRYGDVNGVSAELRNPETGQCELFETWEGGGCIDGTYGDTEAPPESDVWPDWGQCTGYCDGLDEYSCIAASGCRAAYVSDCAEGLDCTSTTYTYFGCWQVAPSGPIQGGGCSGLDAQECSRHDDCSARHYPADGCDDSGDCAPGSDGLWAAPAVGNFESCVDEAADLTGCFEDYECPDGFHCNAEEVCLPSPYSCNGGAGVAALVPCDDRCYGYCVSDEVDPDPGNCYGEVTCLMDPPTCPDGTLPGIADQCYTGYCIPLGDCESAPSCAEVATEAACVARTDCAPIYQGVDCTCDDTGCTCADWLYQECAAGGDTELGCTSDDQCGPGERCCYPCGIPGCTNQCMAPDAAGECPMFP